MLGGFDQLLANMGVLLPCRALGVDGHQSRDGLHNLCSDSFCDGTCENSVTGSLGEGIQGWYLEGEMPLIIASNSRYWVGGIRHTTVGPQFLLVVENSKRMNTQEICIGICKLTKPCVLVMCRISLREGGAFAMSP